MEVTIEIECGNGKDVVQWCFDNLSRPAYLVTLMYYQGRPTTSCPMVWRKWTDRLFKASYGSTVKKNGRYMLYITMGFRSPEDATLFAIKWGSVPFEENVNVCRLHGS